ncbi:MAG: Tm-1-like ATP-binding domain-containing protein, partial [Thermomicrobiales bacterium]|nr:Tm-1-like ATP-binding domain-containing protein [Thermomicrobiales bacterium]
VTTTELADALVGGVFPATPDRLEAAGDLGLPQVVSVGALDMVNFGPRATVPAQFAGRLLYQHNPTITLMRTTPAENTELGRQMARKLNAARSPVVLFIPLRGVSLIDTAGQVFHDPAADAALFQALRENLAPHVTVREVDTDINDPALATAMAETLHALLTERATTADGGAE